MGDGDARWLAIGQKIPALKPENMFYIGARSFEPAEIKYVGENNIFMCPADKLQTMSDVHTVVSTVREKIAGRPFVLSFDFDSIDPKYFSDVWVPESGGISPDAAKYMVESFCNAHSFEFVEYAPTGDTESASLVHDLIEIAVKS